MTMRLGISSEPIRAAVSRMFMADDMAAGMQHRISQHGNLAAVEIDGRPMQPGRARGDHEGDEIRHVLDLAVTDDAGLATELRADLRLRLSGPLDLGADTPPLPLGLDQRRMDAVNAHVILLAEVGEAFGEGRDRGADRAHDREAL